MKGTGHFFLNTGDYIWKRNFGETHGKPLTGNHCLDYGVGWRRESSLEVYHGEETSFSPGDFFFFFNVLSILKSSTNNY